MYCGTCCCNDDGQDKAIDIDPQPALISRPRDKQEEATEVIDTEAPTREPSTKGLLNGGWAQTALPPRESSLGCRESSPASAEKNMFTVELMRLNGEVLGLSVDFVTLDGVGLVVDYVNPGTRGLVQAWNRANASRGCGIRQGDRIIEVNGVRSDGELLQEALSADGMLRMVIERPVELFLTLSKVSGSSRKLGLELGYKKQQSYAMLILRVRRGLVKDWNAKNAASGCAVRVNDRLVEVNGVREDMVAMMSEMRHSTELAIHIWHYEFAKPKATTKAKPHDEAQPHVGNGLSATPPSPTKSDTTV